MTDQQLLDAIKVAARNLADTIDKALEAGLVVDCKVSTADVYYPNSKPRVRFIGVTATRKLS